MWAMTGAAVYPLLLSWATGLTGALVLVDRGGGWGRDHPPMRYQVAGAAAPVLGAAAFVAALMHHTAVAGSGGMPFWCRLAAPWAIPFVAAAGVYAAAWWVHSWAALRRTWGLAAILTGAGALAAVLVAVVATAEPDWRWVVPGGVFAASAAQLGGLSLMALNALSAPRPGEVAGPGNPYGVPAVLFAAGLLGKVVVLLDVLSALGWSLAGPGPGGAVAVWAGLGLAAPVALVGLGHWLWPRWQWAVWSTALASDLAGLYAAQSVVVLFPGLVPPLPF